MQSVADVIYQVVFFATLWRGDVDFLIKCDMPFSLGDFSYEVLDVKLARTAEPKHIMQPCLYSELLTNLQGLRLAYMNLFLGDHEKHSSVWLIFSITTLVSKAALKAICKFCLRSHT